ncbi:MAG TPA: IS66 family transposase [Candidatus Limnocylindrales bacterium]|nr:IS66 family transposase [Candidatus Limnocylindrales bacterium]
MSTPPIPSAPADLELIAQLKSRLQYAELRIRVLEEQLRLMRIEKYGAGGEKLSHAQMELFALEAVISEVMVPGKSERAPVRCPTKRSCKHPGRQELPPNLPRVERILPCTPDQSVCKSCGRETVVIGYEESSQLDVEPAKYFVLVTKREKRACRSCEELGVVSAPLPPRIIEKCLASDRIVIDTVIGKYCNHTPLYRQSMILERDIGLAISRATLDGWVLKVGELLLPMVAAMRRELISGSYIQADETPVDVQMREGRGKNHQAYLWQYGRPGGSVVFDFRLGRGRDGPKRFLGQFEGILQTDGYTAYDQVGATRMVHAACWAHARRQFFEAVQLNPRDPVATPIVARMDDLFAVDAEARRRVIDLTGRHALRQERAKPLLDDILGKIEEAQSVALPSSALSKACQYALTLWRKLTRFLEYPELELSNNLAENSMRPVALGRKNWIHIGSPQAGPKVAAILSVVESCRRLKLPVRDYLAAVLPGFADLPIQRLPDRTPAAWVAQHS